MSGDEALNKPESHEFIRGSVNPFERKATKTLRSVKLTPSIRHYICTGSWVSSPHPKVRNSHSSTTTRSGLRVTLQDPLIIKYSVEPQPSHDLLIYPLGWCVLILLDHASETAPVPAKISANERGDGTFEEDVAEHRDEVPTLPVLARRLEVQYEGAPPLVYKDVLLSVRELAVVQSRLIQPAALAEKLPNDVPHLLCGMWVLEPSGEVLAFYVPHRDDAIGGGNDLRPDPAPVSH